MGLGFDFNLIIAYLFKFLVLLVVLRVVAYKPILAMLERRKREIADGLDAANKVRAEAEAERAKFQSELDSARQSSQEEASRIAKTTEEMRGKILEEARKEAEALKEKARVEIEA